MKKNVTLFFICLVCINDYMGLALVLSTTAPLLLATNSQMFPVHGWFFNASMSIHERLLVMGFLLATFPFAQFFFAPFWGALSDKHGRKPILIMTLAKSTFCYALAGIAILIGNLWLLFFARFIGGLAAGNITAAQGAITDISSDEERTKNLGLVSMSAGFGFLIGPVVGGRLSEHALASWFNFSTPYFFGAIMFFITLLFFIFCYHDHGEFDRNKPIRFFSNFSNLMSARTMPLLFKLFLVWILISLGINTMQFNMPAFFVKMLQFNASQIGNYLSLLALGFVFSNAVLVRFWIKKFKIEMLLVPAMLGLAFFTLLILLNQNPLSLYPIIFCWGLCNGLFYSAIFPVVSNCVSQSQRGQAFGSMWSIDALAKIIVPSCSGFLLALSYDSPFIIGFIVLLIGTALYIQRSLSTTGPLS